MKTLVTSVVVIVIAAGVATFVMRSPHLADNAVKARPARESPISKEDLGVTDGGRSGISARPQADKTPIPSVPYLRIVEGKFGLVLASFDIAPDRLDKVKRLLAEREAAKDDLSALRGDADEDLARGARLASPTIDQGFRDEIQAVLTPSEWQNVSRMLEVEYTLFGLEHALAGPLISSGEPLSGHQLYLIADEYHVLRGGTVDHLKYAASIDPTTKLTAADEAALARLSGTLSPDQLSRLKAVMVDQNERISRWVASNRANH